MSKIIEKLQQSADKGNLLENVLKDILQADDFYNVRIQNKGSQFGFDLFANKQNGIKTENWKFECKNLNTKVNVDNFAPKIIWHLNPHSIDKFVLVTILDISNDLLHLLETIKFSFPIEIWTADYLEYKIAKNKIALERLALERLDLLEQFTDNKIEIKPIFYQASSAKFYVLHAQNPPFSYDYFYLNDVVNKTYTENNFKLISMFENNTDDILKINSLVVKTLKYNSVNSRILRQHKMKGIFKAEKFTFTPKCEIGDEIELLDNDSILKIPAKTDETIYFELSNNSKSGYYEIIFIAKGFLKDIPVTFCSPIFPLHIKDKSENFLQLTVIGKHYESPVSTLLKLDDSKWNELRRLTWNKNLQVYLGNTIDDIVKNQLCSDWEIKTVKLKKVNKTENLISSNSKTYMNLNLPILEKPFDFYDSLDNVLNNS